MIKLILADCIEAMSRLSSGSVDMIFTDLPYGTTRCKWDTPIDLPDFWKEAKRVVKAGAVTAMFAQTPFDKILGASNISQLKYEWIWEKTQATGHFNAKKMPMKAHENILIFYDSKPVYNPQMTHGHKPVNSFTKCVETQNRSEIYGKAKHEIKGGGSTDRYPRTVLKGPSDKQTSHLHPAQKPVWLCETLIRTYTNTGAVVLDCCMGSGSIGIACKQTGRSYIGIDNERRWYDIACKRLQYVADKGGTVL